MSMFLLNSLFGQFSKDTLFFIPMSLVSWAVILSFFLTCRLQFMVIPLTRYWYWHNMTQKAVVGFIFRDSTKAFEPWVLALYALKTMLMMVKMVGLLPYSLTFTSHISFTYSLAFPLWGAMQVVGFIYHFNHRVSHFLPTGTPWGLVPLMVMIEVVGLFMQPVALGLRLAANITAGHLLIFLFSVAVWNLLESSMILSLTFLVVLFLLFLLEMGVALIQAYVFVALLQFYFSQKVEH